ncbi:hypothetical protein V1286_005515 [Bradyrhizobium algeriense]|uniref:Uncharacterized protein n=1 Tax=Bradyrhizobium algeriense TaxID=634784 RepID=A0ABU8BHF4_9BRAD
MQLVDFTVAGIFGFSGITIGLGAAVMALVPTNHRVARILFWLGAVSFGSMGTVWGINSEDQSLTIRMTVAFICAGIAAAGLVWALSELRTREKVAQANIEETKPAGKTKPTSTNQRVTGNDNVVTGPVAGGQVASIINNFYGASSGPQQNRFSEDADTPVTFSIGCMNFRPIKELLESINSGNPTPFLSAQRAGAEPIPLVSLYMKDGAIWADINLFAPYQKYVAFSLKGMTFKKLAPNWDVNASTRAIEVVDENRVPIFQLLRTSNSHLRIDGFFRADDRILFLGRGGLLLNVLRGEDAKRYVPPSDFLPKLFKYPSREHPGEMVFPEPPRPSCPPESQGISAISKGLTLPL